MAEDIADSLDDLICAWDKMMGADLETLVLLLLGWLGFGGLIFLVAHIIYSSLGAAESADIKSPSLPQAPGKIDGSKPHLKEIASAQTKPQVNGDKKSGTSDNKPQVVRLSRELPKLVSKPRPNSGVLSNGIDGLKPEGNPPVSVGSDPHVVEYINTCWKFIYSTKSGRDLAKRVWLEKMNSFTEKSARDDGLLIEFVDVIEDDSLKWQFSNMTAEQQSSKNMFVTCDLDAILKLKIKVTRPIKAKSQSSELVLCIDKLRARFSVAVILEEKSLICKLEGWPNLTINIISGNHQKELSREDQSLYDLIEDITSSAIRGVQINIKLDDLPGFPIYTPKVIIPTTQENAIAQYQRLSSKFSKFGGGKNILAAHSVNGKNEQMRQLEIKIVKAAQLGGQSGSCIKPYVVIEVDEPSQRFQTKSGSGPQTVWDQSFTMNISASSSEILVEVWDQGQKVGDADLFMGLGIVSVSELLVTVSQRHVIPLQGRPMEKDQVSGMLTLEFLFKDGGLNFPEAETLPGIHRATELRQTKGINGAAMLNTTTTYSLQDQIDGCECLPLDSVHSINLQISSSLTEPRDSLFILRRESYLRSKLQDVINGNDEIASVAVKELLMHSKTIDRQPNKSTLMIHSVQKRVATPSSSAQSGGVPDSTNNVTDSVTDATSQTSIDSGQIRRGREKKRNLVSSIKKRISGTTRSLSGGLKLGGDSRNSSIDRGESWERGHARSVSEHHRPASIGSSGDISTDTDSGCSISLPSFKGDISLSWESDTHLRLPGVQSEDASSLSDVSGISAASHKTYITEESSLVIETLENGMQHHYLIPPQVAKGGRFKKRGTKLHIFLDHIFVARHIKLGTACCVCSSLIPMRLGKQAYVCRDCGIITHKPCHVKVETHCQRTSLPGMELEYLG